MFDSRRIVVFAAALFLGMSAFGLQAFAQLPHLPVLPGAVSGQANAAAMAQQHAMLMKMFDQNGNGQLEQAELRMAQMMMLMMAGGNGMRPATGFVPVMPPDEDTSFQTTPAPSTRKARRKRAERIADFAKAKNMAPAKQAAPRAKKVKARGPMVDQKQQQGGKQAPVKGGGAD